MILAFSCTLHFWGLTGDDGTFYLWGRNQGGLGRNSLVGSGGKAPVGSGERRSLEAGAFSL